MHNALNNDMHRHTLYGTALWRHPLAAASKQPNCTTAPPPTATTHHKHWSKGQVWDCQGQWCNAQGTLVQHSCCESCACCQHDCLCEEGKVRHVCQYWQAAVNQPHPQHSKRCIVDGQQGNQVCNSSSSRKR